MENFSTCERTDMRIPPLHVIMFVFLFFIMVTYALDPHMFIREIPKISAQKG